MPRTKANRIYSLNEPVKRLTVSLPQSAIAYLNWRASATGQHRNDLLYMLLREYQAEHATDDELLRKVDQYK